jgi:hypothetical protein
MLREHNSSIPVRVILVEDQFPEPKKFLDFCQTTQVEVWKRPQLDGENYFQNNKVYLREFQESSVLLLDSDTFIMGDVQALFDAYQHFDVTACRNDWVWSFGFKREYLPRLEVPLNSGVALYNQEFGQAWARTMIPYAAMLQEGSKYQELSNWLYQIHPKAYNREEFAFSICASEGFNIGHFKDEHCKVARWPHDLTTFQRSTLIFHSFTHKWQECYKNLRKSPVKLFKYKKKHTNLRYNKVV